MRDSIASMIESIRRDGTRLDEESLWKMRGHILAARANFSYDTPSSSDREIIQLLDRLLDVNGRHYEFVIEVRGKLSAESLNKMATLFEIGTVTVLGIQDFLAGEDLDIQKLLYGTLANLLNVMGSTQYIQAWNEETESLLKGHLLYLRDKLWEMPAIYGRIPTSGVIQDARQGIDEVFLHLKDQQADQLARIAAVEKLYGLVFALVLRRLAQRS